MNTPSSRRQFIKKTTLLAGASLTLPSAAIRRPGNQRARRTAATPLAARANSDCRPARLWRGPGAFPAHDGVPLQLRGPGLVPRCQVRHLGHWGPQCQPEQGDWYAQHMYQFNNAMYRFHVQTYGHPSKFGFKDVCNVWKAEKWDPVALIALYKKAGAKFFAAMANHHDNMDMFDSTYQPWNSVKVGPKKDIVGGWAKAARAAGLRFAVSSHAGRTWSWYRGRAGIRPQRSLGGCALRWHHDQGRRQGPLVGRSGSAGHLRAISRPPTRARRTRLTAKSTLTASWI